MDTAKGIKYLLYIRKSTEAEDRQALSLPAQFSELTSIAIRDNLDLITPHYEESMSAKAPGRPLFNEMLNRIEKGEANAIFAWHPDRLSRNSIDTGRIVYLFDLGKLHELRTPTQVFHNTPSDKFLLSLLCSTAKLENDNKGINVKRGLKKKAEMGWYPCCIPIGYMYDTSNRKGFREIIKDPDRFSIVRRMFDMLLSGIHNPPQIWRKAVDEWGLRSRQGSKFSRSAVYTLFTNPFYYGSFEYPKKSGNWYEGKHQPMISVEEYDRIQMLLGNDGVTRPQGKYFAFTGLIRCGECGAMITAETKNQVICPTCRTKFSCTTRKVCPTCNAPIEKMHNPTVLQYTYYHCTKRRDPDCSQGGLERKQLESQIDEILSNIEISPKFHDWAIRHLRIANTREFAGSNEILASQRKRHSECLKKLNNLLDLRLTDEISAAEYSEKKAECIHEKQRLEELFNNTGNRVDKWIDDAERVFVFARDARKRFATGSPEEKKQILQALGSNLILMDKRLSIKIEEPLVLIEKVSREVNSIPEMFEPEKPPQIPAYTEQPYADNLKTCPVLTPFEFQNVK